VWKTYCSAGRAEPDHRPDGAGIDPANDKSRCDGRWHTLFAAGAALSVDAFKGELMEIAKHGRVLVLLDACHSGATSLDGSSQAVDAAVLRRELAAANVTGLTSSGRSEVSLEDDAWQHGAFTRALQRPCRPHQCDRVGALRLPRCVVAHWREAEPGHGGAVRHHGVRSGSMTRTRLRFINFLSVRLRW
jgi:hypothetical protein